MILDIVLLKVLDSAFHLNYPWFDRECFDIGMDTFSHHFRSKQVIRFSKMDEPDTGICSHA